MIYSIYFFLRSNKNFTVISVTEGTLSWNARASCQPLVFYYDVVVLYGQRIYRSHYYAVLTRALCVVKPLYLLIT